MASHSGSSRVLAFEGCNFFRQRIVLATLSMRPIRIKRIREDDDEPGLTEFEANLLRLMDKISNGSKIRINETGTCLDYVPGMLVGGMVDHTCNNDRSIGWYLEVLLCLAPFCKKPLKAHLLGVTNNQLDPSVDAIKLGCLPVLKRFLGSDIGLELKTVKRGVAPDGGGEVTFNCPCKRRINPLQYLEPGKVKRIRGFAWACRVSPAMGNRLIEGAKGVLNNFLPDIYIYADHLKGQYAGKSPGFGICLVAETLNGTTYVAETASNPKESGMDPSIPEDLGEEAAMKLLQEIYRGGCVDSSSQSLASLLMVLGEPDVSKLVTGPLSGYTIQFLRHLRDFFQVMFKIESRTSSGGDKTGAGKGGEVEEDLKLGCEKVLLTCMGVGFSNISKAPLDLL